MWGGWDKLKRDLRMLLDGTLREIHVAFFTSDFRVLSHFVGRRSAFHAQTRRPGFDQLSLLNKLDVLSPIQ
jgi:hypothetical protein